MDTVHVALGERAYDVKIDLGLLARAGAEIAPFLSRTKVAVVTDDNVAKLHLQALRLGLSDAGIDMVSLVLPAGEQTKAWAYLSQTVDWLLEQKVERNDVVIAFGGGVIGDLA
ncbi:MAG: 3-dehydroquinate synthase, partial [Paracoccaceae bacterium]